MAIRCFFGIGVHAAGDRFAQIILAAVFANFGGNITNDDRRVVALQRNCSGTGVCMASFSDGVFHHDILCLNVSFQRTWQVFRPDDKTRPARFPHLNPLKQAGEKAIESLREFNVNRRIRPVNCNLMAIAVCRVMCNDCMNWDVPIKSQ